VSGLRGSRHLMVGSIVLAQLCVVGCTSPAGLQSANSSSQEDQHSVPFHEENAKVAGPVDSSATQENDSKPDTPLPFRDPKSLPAGTLLTVRLKRPIFAGNPNANGAFDAVIDQAVIIDGNQLVPLGTLVSGRVESAQASHLKGKHGYLRLTLGAIHLAGSNVPVQTSSLFVGGNAGTILESPNQQPPARAGQSVVELEKGRRLVFRLTEPVYVAATNHSSSAN
jgi:hypothetical protein